MQINMGNFGDAVAAPQRDAYLPTDNAVPNALQNVAHAGQQLANAFQQLDEQKQRAQAAATLATLDNDVYDAHDQVSRGVQDGSIKPEDAMVALNDRVQDIKKQRTAGLTQYQLDAIEPHVIKTTGALARNLQGVAIKRTQDDIGATILSTGETLQRAALRDLPTSISQYDNLIDQMGPKAGWTPEKITVAKQAFKEGATYNFANAMIEGAAQTGDIALVRAAREKIEGPDGEPIDPAKRQALITKAYGYENGILAQTQRDADKADREQQARENSAVDAYNQTFDLVMKGRYLSTEAINDLADATAGTKMAGQAQQLVQAQKEVAGFASLSLPQQQAVIERQNAAGSDPTIGVTALEQKVADQFKSIHDASVKAYAENPWQAAQERAVIKDAPVISVNNIQDAQAVLADRMKNINVVEVAAGRKVSPLQPQEAEQVGKMIRMLPPDQQSSALASFGTLIGNPDRVAALAKQIDGKDKVLSTAIMYANSQTTQGRYVSELILRGERALKDGTIKPDAMKESGWRAEIAKQIGDAYPNQEVRQRMIDAAYYIKAGLTSDGTVKDSIDSAVRLATGGIVEQRDGSKVPLPYGMTENQFYTKVKGFQPADLSAQVPDGKVFVGKTAVPLDQFIKQLPDASLVHAGQGLYSVRAGSGYVLNSAGQRIILKVSP